MSIQKFNSMMVITWWFLGITMAFTIYTYIIEIPGCHQALKDYRDERKAIIYDQGRMKIYVLDAIVANNAYIKDEAFKPLPGVAAR